MSQSVQSSGSIRREILEFRASAVVTRAVELNFLISLLLLVLLALTSPFRSAFIALGDVITTKGSTKSLQNYGVARLHRFVPPPLKTLKYVSHGLLESLKPSLYPHSAHLSGPFVQTNGQQRRRRRLIEVASGEQTDGERLSREAVSSQAATVDTNTEAETRNLETEGDTRRLPDGSIRSRLDNHRTSSNDREKTPWSGLLPPMAFLSSTKTHTSADIRLRDSEHCRGIVPGADPDVMKARDSFGPITSLEQLQALKELPPQVQSISCRPFLQPGQRVLVVIPKFGLGNSLNGFISSYIFATLMGRRIVILHAGDYGAVFSSLCDAFHCAFDHVRSPSMLPTNFERTHAGSTNRTFIALLTWLYNQPGLKKEGGRPVDRNAAVLLHHSDHPVVFAETNALWDRWWQRDRRFRECVVSALGRDYQAAALHALLGRGPKPQLSVTIETILKRHDSASETRSWPPPHHSLEHGRRLSGKAVSGSGMAFESQHTRDAREEDGAGGSEAEGDGGADLRFDVAIHVRTAHRALEKPREAALCNLNLPSANSEASSAAGLNSAAAGAVQESSSDAADSSNGAGGRGNRRILIGGRGKKVWSKKMEEVCRKMREEREWQEQRFFNERAWRCLGVLLRSLKQGVAKQGGRRLQEGLKEQGEEQKSSGRSHYGLPVETETLNGFGMEERIPPERSRHQGAGPHNNAAQNPPFSIFLATDHEAFRPRFVERLAQFGVVYYNGFGVAHLGVAGGNETASRLASLAEFYLMARSRVIVELDASYISTFASTAALLGNSTLLSLALRTGSVSRCARPRVVRHGGGLLL